MAYALGSAGKSGAAAVGSGMAAVGDAAVGAATSPLRKAGDGMKQSFREGSRAAITNTGGTITPGPNTPPSPPPTADAGPARLGQGDEGPADHLPRRDHRRPHAEIWRQPWRRGFHRHFRKGLIAMFRRPSIRYGKTPEPETPYQRAAQVWDDRIGSARVQARSWRLAFFGALGLSTCLTAGIIWQGARGSIIPWVVQVDKLGEAQAVAPADVGYMRL
jgi:hypothetical protein